MALAPLSGSSHFTEEYGMPTNLWRMLYQVGYQERPIYTWETITYGDQLVTTVHLSVLALEGNPIWKGWEITTTGLSPEEAANNAAFQLLRGVNREHPGAL